MGGVDFGLLGPLEVRRGESQVPIGKRQHRAVLAMLLVRPNEVVPTDELVEGLWPRTLPDQPLATLQTHIARLRRALEPDRPAGSPNARLLTRPPGYLLTVGPQELDVSRFQGLAMAGRTAAARGDAARSVERLDAALAQWRGPAFGEFRDEAFASAAVARLEEERIGALEDRMGACLAIGRAADLVPELEELVLRHPLRERLWAHLALALYRSDRQADAIRRCRDAQAALGEIGLDAGPALRQLEEAILRHDPELLIPPVEQSGVPAPARLPSLVRPTATRVGPPPPVSPPLPPWLGDERPVVDRDEALAAADRVWQAVVEGNRRLLLFRGEPGIGKTRLAGHMASSLTDEGVVVVTGRCSEEPLLPHEPFIEAVRRVTESNPGLIVGLGAEAGHLTPLLPGLALTVAVDDPDVSPDTARYLMFNAVDRLLSALAVEQPAVLVLDDLQWADRSTLRLLTHLVGNPGRPLLVIGTYRDTELAPGHPLPDALAELHRSDLVTDIGLRRLSAEAVTHLVRSEGLPETVGGRVFSRTAGNPLFVREVIQNLLPDWDRSRVLEIPDNVRALLLRRLRKLPTESRRTLEAASVMGRRIDADLLARVQRRSMVDVAADLAAATRAGLLVDDPAAGVVFAHDLAREVTENDLTGIARAVLHRAVGEAVLERDGDGDAHLGTLARHFTAAAVDGDPHRAVEYSHRAGRRSFELLAHDEAVSRFQSGLAALERSGSEDEQGRLTLLVDLIDAHYRAGDEYAAAAAADQAWEIARHVGTSEQRVRAATGVAYATWSDAERAKRAVEAMLEARQRIGNEPTADLARQLQVLAATYGLIGQHREGAGVMRRALEVADAVDDPLARGWIRFHASSVLVNEATVEERIRWTEQALVTADEHGDRELQVLSMVQLRVLHLENGDLLGTERVWSRYQREVEELNIPRYNAGHAQRRGMLAMLRGDYEEAEMAANEMVVHQPNDTFVEGLAVMMLVIRLDQGRMAELEPYARDLADRQFRPPWLTAHAVVLTEMEHDREAAARVAPVVDQAHSLERNLTWLSTLVTAALSVSWVGTPEQATVLRDLLLPERHRLCLIGTGAACLGSVEHHLGRLEAVRGDLDRAECHLRRSLEVHEHVQAPPRAAHDRVSLAQVLLRRDGPGDRDEAAELLDIGLTAADRYGLDHRSVRWARAARSVRSRI